MTEEEIVKVMQTLIGETSPIGETHHDHKVLANIWLYMEVIDTLIMYIIEDNTSLTSYMRSLASVEDCREAMLKGLKKIKERIEECLEEEVEFDNIKDE